VSILDFEGGAWLVYAIRNCTQSNAKSDRPLGGVCTPLNGQYTPYLVLVKILHWLECTPSVTSLYWSLVKYTLQTMTGQWGVLRLTTCQDQSSGGVYTPTHDRVFAGHWCVVEDQRLDVEKSQQRGGGRELVKLG
jgi:hypothetical protein